VSDCVAKVVRDIPFNPVGTVMDTVTQNGEYISGTSTHNSLFVNIFSRIDGKGYVDDDAKDKAKSE
jgi:hypothetical protein